MHQKGNIIYRVTPVLKDDDDFDNPLDVGVPIPQTYSESDTWGYLGSHSLDTYNNIPTHNPYELDELNIDAYPMARSYYPFGPYSLHSSFNELNHSSFNELNLDAYRMARSYDPFGPYSLHSSFSDMEF